MPSHHQKPPVHLAKIPVSNFLPPPRAYYICHQQLTPSDVGSGGHVLAGGGGWISHRPPSLVQLNLVRSDKHALLGRAGKVADSLHGTVVLPCKIESSQWEAKFRDPSWGILPSSLCSPSSTALTRRNVCMERAVLYVRKRPTSPENILKLKAGLFGGKISHFLSPLLSSLPLFPPREYIYVCVAPRLSPFPPLLLLLSHFWFLFLLL